MTEVSDVKSRRFEHRRALVTGAGGGIGAATARRLLLEGARVTGVDIDADALTRQHDSLGELAGQFTPVTADIAEAGAATQLLDVAVGPDGSLDVLVNNAAVWLYGSVDATPEKWRRTFEVNLLAPAQIVAAAVEALSRADHPAIVNVASISGHVAQAGAWPYNSMKGGMLELTRCQALDLAPYGIRVNSVSPGFIWTDALDRIAGGDRATWDPRWGAYCLLGRCAEPAEVASVIAFLASDDASYVTGADLRVDAGLTAIGPDSVGAGNRVIQHYHRGDAATI